MDYGLKPQDLEKIITIFKKYSDVNEVVLYGSRAKGNFKLGSDIDLTVKGDHLTLEVLQTIENELDDLLLPYTFDLSSFDSIDNKDLIDHIKRVGIPLFVRNEA